MTEDQPADENFLERFERLQSKVEDEELQSELADLRDCFGKLSSQIQDLRFELDETQQGTLELTTELQQAKRRFQSLFDNSAIGIYVTDAAFEEYIAVNQTFLDILGYDDEESLQSSVDSIREDVFANPERYDAFQHRLQMEGQVVDFTYRIDTEGKQERHVTDNVVSIGTEWFEDGGYRGGIVEVTDRVEKQQQLVQIDRVLRHNLRNELNVLEAHAIELREELPAEQKDRVDAISDGLYRIDRAAKKSRELIRFFAKGAAITVQDVVTVIQSLQKEFRPEYPQATIEIDGPDSQKIEAVEEFRWALMELLENAMEHIDGEGPSVTISVEQVEDRVEIAVADQGPGIPDIEAQTLTDPEDMDEVEHGGGLGLWIVYWVVQRSGGTIDVESGEDGTTITLSMAAAPDQPLNS